MQKYSCSSRSQGDGAVLWFVDWIGGSSLSKIENCRVNLAGEDWRRTVYTMGEPDTFFSQPAICKIRGCRVEGFVTCDDNGDLYFQHQYGG